MKNVGNHVFKLSEFVSQARLLVESGREDGALKVGSRTLHVVGQFNRTSTLKRTRESFLAALRSEYGENNLSSDPLFNDLSKNIDKPLSARTILALVKDADDARSKTLEEGARRLLSQMKAEGLDGSLGNANLRRAVASLNDGQMRQLSAFLHKKALSCYNKQLVRPHLDTEDEIAVFLRAVVNGQDVLAEKLASVCDKMSPAAVSRFLDILEHAPDVGPLGLHKVIAAVQAENPEAFDSQEAFAENLRRRLGRPIQLPPETEGNLSMTIGVLGSQMANDLFDYLQVSRRIGLDEIFGQSADEALQWACENGKIDKKDLDSYKDDIKVQLMRSCRVAGRLFMTAADVKLSLFSVICNRRLAPVQGNDDPPLNFLIDGDFLKESQEIGSMDYDHLFVKIDEFCASKEKDYATFRENRDEALARARDKIRILGSDFGLNLTNDDINMLGVEKKFTDADISELKSKDAVFAVVEKKKVAVLKKLADSLKNSSRFTQEGKAAIFRTLCASPSIPTKTFERLEDLIGGYDDALAWVIADQLGEIEKEISTLSDGKEVNAERREALYARFSILTTAMIEHVCKPFDRHAAPGEVYGADDWTVVLDTLAGVIDGRDDDRLRRLAKFVRLNEHYQTWMQDEGIKAFGEDMKKRVEALMFPLAPQEEL